MAEKTDREFVEWCTENFEFLADPDDGTPIDPDRKIVLFTSEDEDRLSRLSGGATHDWDISHCTLAMLRLGIAESRTQVAALTAERDTAKAELAAAKQERDAFGAAVDCPACQRQSLYAKGRVTDKPKAPLTPDATKEELRQACDRLRGQLYDVSLVSESDLSRVVDFALSRLDREAEAERRLLNSAAIINAAIRVVRESAPGNETHLEYWAEQTKANMAFLNHAPLPDDGPYTDKLAESERLLKVAREAIENAAHAINCEYLSPIHAVCGHPANSRKHSCACDADWIPPAELKQRDCNCWKARVLAEIAPAAPEAKQP